MVTKNNMKKLTIVVMLLGVVTLQSLAKEKYRILVRKTTDGKEIFIPMKKQYNGTWLKQWVSTDNIYSSRESAENVIKEWISNDKALKEYNNKKYIYIN
jgi:hypothetical protein